MSYTISASGSSYTSWARSGPMYSVVLYSPRRSSQSCMIGPMSPLGRMNATLAIGSRNSSITPGSGTSCGLSIL